MWLCQFLIESGFPPSQPTPLYEDNKSAIHIVNNGKDKGRTKHMDIRYYYVRELVQSNHITVLYKPTTSMVADVFTKPLDFKQFLLLRNSHHILMNLIFILNLHHSIKTNCS